MPRITAERWAARRGDIVAAALRLFSRDGFHQTSMPDVAAEAGLSTGAPYRYFPGKEHIIVEIAGQAFATMFSPLDHVVGQRPVTAADLVALATDPLRRETTHDAAGREVPIEELLRCGVQTWAELLHHEPLRRRAAEGFGVARDRLADALRRGQAAGTVPVDLDAEYGARVLMALLHGFLLQRVAFDLDDTDGFARGGPCPAEPRGGRRARLAHA